MKGDSIFLLFKLAFRHFSILKLGFVLIFFTGTTVNQCLHAKALKTQVELLDSAKAVLELDPEKCKVLCYEMLAEAKNEKAHIDVSKVYLLLGSSLISSGQYDSALAALNQVDFNHTNDVKAQHELKYQKARAYYYLGNYPPAIKLLLEVVDSKTEGDYYFLRSLYMLGEVYRASDNTGLAKKYCHKAINTAINQNNDKVRAAALNRLGVVLAHESKHDSAEFYLQQAKKISESKNLEAVLVRSYNDLGELYFALDEFEKAKNEYSKALPLAKSIDDRLNTLTNIARLDLKLKHYSRVIADAKEALELAQSTKVLTYELDALRLLSRANNELGNYQESVKYYEVYFDKKDQLFENEKNRQLLELEKVYQTKQKEQQIENLTVIKEKEESLKTLYLIGFLVVSILLILLLALADLLRKSNQRLKNANQTKDKFFSIISYDLRSSVSAFQGLGSVINNYVKKEKWDRLIKLGEKIDLESSKLESLLNNLLSWSMAQLDQIPYSPESLCLKPRVEEVLKLMDERIQIKQLSVNLDIDDDHCVYADRDALMLVFRNLIGNAIKFSNAGQNLWVSTVKTKKGIETSIRDEGTGIEGETLKTLFTSNKKKVHKGTLGEQGNGLGLILVKEFLENQGGKIWVKSEVGKGATFTFFIPSK